MEKPELRISTFNVKGKLPFPLHLSEKALNDYILKSQFNWDLMIEEKTSPRLITRYGEPKVTIMLWFNGSMLMNNPKDINQAEKIYFLLVSDLKKHCRRLFEED